MKRALLLLALLLPSAPCPAQGPGAMPLAPTAAERVEARRAALLAEAKALAPRFSERSVCALLPVNARGLPSFKSDSRGNLSLDATVQIDLAAYRAWVAEITPRLRRLALRVEEVRLAKDSRGYRFEAPGREFDASQLVVVDGFSDIPRSLGAHVYTFDIATATELRATDWTAVESSRAWKENLVPPASATDADLEWLENLDTTSSPVRFWRIAVTPFELKPNEEVGFKPAKPAGE